MNERKERGGRHGERWGFKLDSNKYRHVGFKKIKECVNKWQKERGRHIFLAGSVIV